MIIEIAAAAVLTCTEAHQLINRIDLTKYPPVYAQELVRELKAFAPNDCSFSGTTASR
jgi:hypothetical protein